MIKYMQVWDDELNRLVGIKDRETGAFIPMSEGNRHYAEYLQWLAEGNTPVPPRPSTEHEWIDPVGWVLNENKRAERELEDARAGLQATPEFVALMLDVIHQLQDRSLIVVDALDADTKVALTNLDAKLVDTRTKRDSAGREG